MREPYLPRLAEEAATAVTIFLDETVTLGVAYRLVDMDEQQQADAAARLLGRLREFAMDLEGDERELFAVLVGPGIQELTHGDDDVTGFGGDAVRWEPGSLRAQLAAAVQDSEWQIVERR